MGKHNSVKRVKCDWCKGEGKVTERDKHSNMPHKVDCPNCRGEGTVPKAPK